MNDLPGIVSGFTVWILPIIFAVTLHEAAHGYMASLFGDLTARMMGRVTMNPLRHIDPFGTLLLPALCLLAPGSSFLFGYAKPVPVNFNNLRPKRLGVVLVALAGPGTNVILAALSLLIYRFLPINHGAAADWIAQNLVNSARINVLLAVLNMLPLPPLDGGRVLVAILPRPLSLRLAAVESYGVLILMLMMIILPLVGHQIGYNLDLFYYLIGIPQQWLLDLLARLTGVG